MTILKLRGSPPPLSKMSRNKGRMGKETKAKQLTYQDKHCYFTEEKLFIAEMLRKEMIYKPAVLIMIKVVWNFFRSAKLLKQVNSTFLGLIPQYGYHILKTDLPNFSQFHSLCPLQI